MEQLLESCSLSTGAVILLWLIDKKQNKRKTVFCVSDISMLGLMRVNCGVAFILYC